MVQYFQRGPSLGERLGQSIATGFAKNMPDPQMQEQGRQQNAALSRFEKSISPKDSPQDLTIKWHKSMAGVPDSQRLTQSLLPQYQQRAIFQPEGEPQQDGAPLPVSDAGAGGTGGQPISADSRGITDVVPPVAGAGRSGGGQQQTAPPVGQSPGPPQAGQQPSAGGGRPQSGLDANVLQLANALGIDPIKLLELQAGVPQQKIQAQQQSLELARTSELSNFAEERLKGIKATDLNQFMRIGKQYQNLDTEDWFKSTNKDFKKYQNVKSGIDNANLPGIIKGIFRGGKYRDKTLKRAENVVKPLVEMGEEDEARKLLSEWPNNLGPAEVEMLIKPMDQSSIKDLNKLPNAPYISHDNDWFTALEESFNTDKIDYDQMSESNPELLDQITEDYADFLADNVDETVSLLGLREYAGKNKGIDWRQFSDAVNQAQKKGLKLSADQQQELGDLTQAPTNSLNNIFEGWGNWIDWLRGSR